MAFLTGRDLNLDYTERNAEIVGNRMMRIMHMSMDFGREIIDQEVNVGIFNFIVKPIVKTFYNYWSNTEIRKGTIKQIKAVFNCARSLLNDETTEEKFREAIGTFFPDFFGGDSTSKRCKENHRNYDKLKQILYDNFYDKVKETILFLKVDKVNIESYEDLIREVYKSKEEAYNALIKQLNFTDDGISLIESDISIVKVPTAKELIVRALRKGFEMTKEDLLANLHSTYD
jgi:hypothetical protein